MDNEKITKEYKLYVTIESGLVECLDEQDWADEIAYNIYHKAREKFPEQADETGFSIQISMQELGKHVMSQITPE